ncbi:MAG TPA: serine protease [Solirubrobacteraceae bacterium]|nr:serine protease [Solirubrobacteraceae bacterium]
MNGSNDNTEPAARLHFDLEQPERISLAAACVLAALLAAVIAMAAISVAQASTLRRHAHRRAGDPQAHAAVVGGTTAVPPSYPWLAFVADTQNDTACSGTVISPMVVLTAGHCVEDITTGLLQPASAFEVVTGRLDWSDANSGQLLSVQAVIVNPGYTLTTFGTDAALLVLATPTSAPAIALADSADSASLTTPGTVASIAGWGLTSGSQATPPSSLQWGTTVLQSVGYCTLAEVSDIALFDPAADLCALDTPGDTVSACHGDSGGPLVVMSGATPIEVGITSRGDAQCDPADPTVFTAAAAIESWAEDWIAQYPAPAAVAKKAAAPDPSGGGATASGGTRSYSGRSAQPRGAIALSLNGAGTRIARLALTFALRCPRLRGVYHATAHSIALSGAGGGTAGALHFSRRFRTARHWRVAVSGTVAGGAASGTLSVATGTRGCTTGRVHWTAAS